FWISILLFVVAIALLFVGLRRAYSAPESYRGKVAGSILAALCAVLLGVFVWATYQMKKAYPVAQNAPRIGQKAPVFVLTDGNHNRIQLAELLSGGSGAAKMPRGVLLVFYRGYW
ncbi:MAG TPA: hypothetical protein VG498_23980, partial [Terriglobales bacterium]|nr:hypothetical protein [Terriglobales bacterium]